jgi:hypothetical protein
MTSRATVLFVTHPNNLDGPRITSVDEYNGGPSVRISATQVGTAYSAHQAKKIVDGWCEFFSAGPTPITHLGFTSRTPKRLFASLRAQTQLTALGVKWGDYDDLSALTEMRDLRELWLGGASSVRTVGPLAALTRLRSLTVEDLRYVRDLMPMAALNNLRSLEIGGDWKSPRIAHVESIKVLRQLPDLERLVLHTIIADDLDYSPLLNLHRLSEVRVHRVRGMRPSHEELSAAIPALQPLGS